MFEQGQLSQEQLDKIQNYNPVTVTNTDTTGLVGMTAIALILLIALLRAQKHIRDLQQQLAQEKEE